MTDRAILNTFLRTVPILVLGLLAQGQTPRVPAQPRLLVELDPAANLPVGLRVDTFILSGYEQSAALR